MRIQCLVFVFFGLLGVLSAAPAQESIGKSAKILKFDYDDSGKGPYRYGFESSDGITREENGEIHYPGTKREFMKVTGMFRYPGPDGVMYEVRYTADDQGFHPEGDHIKVPPFVPWIHHHDDSGDSNHIGDSAIYETGQVPQVTTPKPTPEYLPSTSTTYLPSSTPKPSYNSGEEILEAYRKTGKCLQSVLCDQENFGSAPGPNTAYLPSTPGPVKADEALNLLSMSTPRPNPEVHFHSTPEPAVRNFREAERVEGGSVSMVTQMMLLIGPMGPQLIPVMK